MGNIPKHSNCLESRATYFFLNISSLFPADVYLLCRKSNPHSNRTKIIKQEEKQKENLLPHFLFSSQGAKVHSVSCTIIFEQTLLIKHFLATISISCFNKLLKQGIKALENSDSTPTFDIFNILLKLSCGNLEFSKT